MQLAPDVVHKKGIETQSKMVVGREQERERERVVIQQGDFCFDLVSTAASCTQVLPWLLLYDKRKPPFHPFSTSFGFFGICLVQLVAELI